MKDTNLDQLWKTVLGEIETEISRANFLTLFKNTALVSLDETTATIATPSVMIINMLQKRFLPVIKKTLDKHAHQNLHVVFISKTPFSKNSKKEESGPLFSSEKPAPVVQTVLPRPIARVRPDYIFQNLAVSSSNQLAFVTCQTVAKNLGKMYNPLFIYGPVGVGKTHLMQAIANEVYNADSTKKVIYTTSEEFTNEVVEAIRTNDTARMKRRFRTIDLLIIDDVQFLAGKDRVQEELFHTFNILIDNTSQVVFSSDRPPQEIPKLEKRLSSRFSSGLTVDIEPPDFELRTAILLIKAKKNGEELTVDGAKIIAEKAQDVRELEGVLLRVITQAKTTHQALTTDFIHSVLGDRKSTIPSMLRPDLIIERVCAFYGVKQTQLKGPKRDASLVRARQVAMYLLKKELNLSYVEIGNILGGRDHTTIMHGVGKMEEGVDKKATVHGEISRITQSLMGQNRG